MDLIESSCVSSCFTQASSSSKLFQHPLRSESWGSVFTEVGQKFEGGADQFRFALNRYSIKFGFGYRMKRNHAHRVVAVCPVQGCGWKIHGCSRFGISSLFYLKKYVPEHTCGGGFTDINKSAVHSTVASNLIESEVKVDPKKKNKAIITTFQSDYGIKIPYHIAYNAKKKALHSAFGDEESGYAKLDWYTKSIMKWNPGSYVQLQLDMDTYQFERVFIAYEACIHGFKYCRPVIWIDGTHLKSKYKGTLLIASAKNGNEGFFTIALAVVSVENNSNWNWFLENLARVVDRSRTYTFLSDRHPSIIKGVGDLFPNAHHSYCVWHIRNNLVNAIGYGSQRADYIESLLYRAARALTKDEFNIHFKEMELVGGRRLTDIFKNCPFEKWANSYFVGKRYGEVCSSLCESYNSWIREERGMSIVLMLETIRVRMMEMMQTRLELVEKWTSLLCPEIDKIIRQRRKFGSTWKVVKSSKFVYEIFSTPSQLVDLSSFYCSCLKWQVEYIPCEHAITAIKYDGRPMDKFVEEYFTTESFKKAYEHAIIPIPNSDEPKEFSANEMIINPPSNKRQPGRPRSVRIESAGAAKFKKKRKCGRCGKLSYHNKRTCAAILN